MEEEKNVKSEEVKTDEKVTQEEKEVAEESSNVSTEKIIQENRHENKHHHHFDVTKDKKYIALKEENEKQAAEIARLKDQLLRNQADFENFRKRSQEQTQKDRKYCLQDFLGDSIDTLDILDKVVSANVEDEKLKNYLIGFKMINDRLKNVLENYGVKKIDCLNKPFDPQFQSALESVEKEGVQPNVVVEVTQTGYMYKDRVLRPAMVKVSK